MRARLAIGVALLLAGCTSGNIVADFEPPTYILVDRLGDGVEIRRYGERTEVGSEVAEVQAESPAELEASALSGLVAARRAAGDDLEAETQAVLDELARSANWQPAGAATTRPGDGLLSFVGREGTVVVVPIERRRPALDS